MTPTISHIEYDGYTIKPKLDFGPGRGHYIKGRYVKEGWVVTKGGANVLPGATWGETTDDAMRLLHCYIAAGEESDIGGRRFWSLVRLTSPKE